MSPSTPNATSRSPTSRKSAPASPMVNAPDSYMNCFGLIAISPWSRRLRRSAAGQMRFFSGMLLRGHRRCGGGRRALRGGPRNDERLQAWPWLAHTKHEFALVLRDRGGPGDQDRADALLAPRRQRARSVSEWRRCKQRSDRLQRDREWNSRVKILRGEDSMPRFLIERNFAERLELTKEVPTPSTESMTRKE